MGNRTDVNRAVRDKLFDEHVAKNPPPLARKTASYEARYGKSFDAAVTAHVTRPDPVSTLWSVVPVALAVLLVVLLVLLAGCSVDPELRRHVEVMDDACRELRDASQPAAGVDSAAWVRLRDSSERAHQTAVEAARE